MKVLGNEWNQLNKIKYKKSCPEEEDAMGKTRLPLLKFVVSCVSDTGATSEVYLKSCTAF